MSGRVANGSAVRVLRYSPDRSWLEVDAGESGQGWISARYLKLPTLAEPVEAATPAAAVEGSPIWATAAGCHANLAAGKRLEKPVQRVRVATWNIRWFPDGGPGTQQQPSNIEWLACSIAWMGVDLLAVQEFKRGATDPAVKRLLTLLQTHTGSRWALELDACPNDDRQHVGVLFNADSIQLSRQASEPELNPKGTAGAARLLGDGACAGRLRPGFAATARHSSGLDFEVVVLHLKSGPDPDAYALRRRSLSRLGGLLKRRMAAADERDVIVLGDWNSMGCESCKPKASAGDERAALEAELSPHGLRLLGSTCTEYYRGKSGALDYVAISREMAEAAGAELQLSGFCAEAKCKGLPQPPAAQEQLSDHCPVLVDLRAADLD